MPKDEFKLPEGWEWKNDWLIAPETSLLFEKDAGYTNYMEEVYEQNFRNLPGSSWNDGYIDKRPFKWSNYVSLVIILKLKND